MLKTDDRRKHSGLWAAIITGALLCGCVVAWRWMVQEQDADRAAAGQYTISVFDYTQDKSAHKRPITVVVSQGRPQAIPMGDYISITTGDGTRTLIARPDMVDVEKLGK